MGELGTAIFATIMVISWFVFLGALIRFAFFKDEDLVLRCVTIFLVIMTVGLILLFTV